MSKSVLKKTESAISEARAYEWEKEKRRMCVCVCNLSEKINLLVKVRTALFFVGLLFLKKTERRHIFSITSPLFMQSS